MHTPTTTNLFKFLFLLITVSFLSSCSSTGLFASRKYTKGHFSERIAKIETGQIPNAPHSAASPSVSQPEKLTTRNTTITKIAATTTKTKPAAKEGIIKQIIAFTAQQKSLNVASPNSTKSLSLDHPSANSVTDYVSGYYADHGKGGNGSILAVALVCLGISILFLLLGLFGGFDSDTQGVFFITFGLTIGFGVIFLVYWIIAVINSALN